MKHKFTLLKFSLLVGLVLGLSSGFLWFVLPIIELVQSERGWFQRITTLALCILLGTPGLLLLYTVYDLRKEVDRYAIKNFCGIFYAILMLVFGFVLLPMWSGNYSEMDRGLSTFGSLFVSIAGLLPIYVVHAKALMRSAKIVPERGELFGRQTLGLLAFLMMMCLMDLARITGVMDGSPAEDRGQKTLTAFLLILVVPLVSYRLSVRWLLKPISKS